MDPGIAISILIVFAILVLIILYSHKVVTILGGAKEKTLRSSDSFFGRITPTFI